MNERGKFKVFIKVFTRENVVVFLHQVVQSRCSRNIWNNHQIDTNWSFIWAQYHDDGILQKIRLSNICTSNFIKVWEEERSGSNLKGLLIVLESTHQCCKIHSFLSQSEQKCHQGAPLVKKKWIYTIWKTQYNTLYWFVIAKYQVITIVHSI